jgi:hypothetical protein
MSMIEVRARKERIDTAIHTRDPGLFANSFVAWLEAIAYLRVAPNFTKIGLDPGPISKFTYVDLRETTVRVDADDTIMAYCIACGLKGDASGFRGLHNILTHQLGVLYPGSTALAHCNQIIDPIVSLDDAVGQVLKAMLEGQSFDAAGLWNAGLRVLQRLRSSNFAAELAPLLADWLRSQWTAAAADPDAYKFARAATAVPAIKQALADQGTDQAFIAGLLHAAFDAINPDLDPEYRKQLAVIARRP